MPLHDQTLFDSARGIDMKPQARLDIPMVLITHDPDDVAAFGDQVVQVNDGCVRESQPFTGYGRSAS